jgi:hypothetical protein
MEGKTPMEDTKTRLKPQRFPVMFDGAEYLAMGFLARRNIASYLAPPRQAHFDLICIHPSGKHKQHVLVQVKSRFDPTGSAVDIAKGSLNKFDFLIVVHWKIHKPGTNNDEESPDLYVFPHRLVQRYFLPKRGRSRTSGRFYFRTHKASSPKRLAQYMNSVGIELIARHLQVPRPLQRRVKMN